MQHGFGPIIYSTAKAAIIQMTRIAAGQLGPLNIRVNCICPGFIATAIIGKAFGLATQVADTTTVALAEAGKSIQPIPRGGLPRDIAEGVLYLASDGASFVNGHALVIDGGLTIGTTGAGQAALMATLVQAVGGDVAAVAAAVNPATAR